MAVDMDFLGKGLGFPARVDSESGKCELSSGEDLIEESILMILGTAKGERVMRPDFGCGIRELIFAPNNTVTATLVDVYIKEALLKWEPRIEVTSVAVTPDRDEDNRLNIDISYRIKTTNTKKNLVYPFYLEGAR